MKKIIILLTLLLIANTAFAYKFSFRPSRINSKYSFSRSALSTPKNGALGSGKDLLFFVKENVIANAVKKTIESVEELNGKEAKLEFISTEFCNGCAKDAVGNTLNAIEIRFYYSELPSIIVITQAVIQVNDSGKLEIQIVPGIHDVNDEDGLTYFYYIGSNGYLSLDNYLDADEINLKMAGTLPMPTEMMDSMISFSEVRIEIVPKNYQVAIVPEQELLVIGAKLYAKLENIDIEIPLTTYQQRFSSYVNNDLVWSKHNFNLNYLK